MGCVWVHSVGVFLAGVLCAIQLGGCTVDSPSPHEIILQGADAWNQWREANPDAIPDLSGIVLEGADLCSANLNAISLKGAVLRNAQLSNASLSEADLSGANLVNAGLDGAILRGANLSAADLTGANLSGGNLAGANLAQANLGKATLTAADLSNATVEAIVNWQEITNLQGANIYRIVRAPSGFKDFALTRGAKKDG